MVHLCISTIMRQFAPTANVHSADPGYGPLWQVVDPNLKEEAAMGGRLTLTLNTQGEVCAVQKGGGVAVTHGEIMRCMRVAAIKGADLSRILKKEVQKHAVIDLTFPSRPRYSGSPGLTI